MDIIKLEEGDCGSHITVIKNENSGELVYGSERIRPSSVPERMSFERIFAEDQLMKEKMDLIKSTLKGLKRR